MNLLRVVTGKWLRLGLCLLLLAEAVWVVHRRAAIVVAARRLTEVHDHRRQLVPEAEEQEPIAEESRRTETLLRWQHEVLGEQKIASMEPEPLDRAAAYFELVRCTEALAEAAQSKAVQVRAGEAFGFATYAQAGPERDVIPLVHRQRRVVDRVVRLLLETRPRSLVQVQRERPSVAAARAGRGDGAAADFFAPEHCRRVPPGLSITSTLVRVTFETDTAGLRAFLQVLAESVPSLVVRGVEAEPVLADSADALRPGMVETESILVPTLTRFAVTIEALEWAGATPRSAALSAALPR